ncbi:MAG: putative molybdenum carrier protein [Candidatus Omnitrophica bacterium]|nr:putative molybdenum carrier protein [Candidatus Omnitrophota bacterium]
MNRLFFVKILSGGQTGADRAALDFAIEHGIPHGGWCPKGRIAEDGEIDERYDLKETPSTDYDQRTEWNVRDSDGTVIFSIGKHLTGGSLFTKQVAENLGKPCLHLPHQEGIDQAVQRLGEFIKRNEIGVLNVAGPRASGEPEVGEFVRVVLGRVLSRSK